MGAWERKEESDEKESGEMARESPREAASVLGISDVADSLGMRGKGGEKHQTGLNV